ncbi:class I adenylate-forming enzyme family protein [Mesorhizobium sp. Root102]|uniref:class I adenylate-forming enzyme family protein n=1 Tax=Mesorhizobium sp. Root102 TaxID=1736422 RepID=UPI0006FD72F0|nr:class I adenylate-forming enzyme family protein [Mesorhizobium sp. Root102]
MKDKNNEGDGVPAQGAFDRTAYRDSWGAPLGAFRGGRWNVDAEINKTITEPERLHVRYAARPKTYDEMFRATTLRFPNQEAVVCGDRRVSYRELDSVVEKTAFGLINAGLKKGDRIAIMLDNRLEYLVAILAAVRAGGIAVPLGTRLGPSDVSYIVGDATPVLAVTGSQWLEKFPASGSSLQRVFVVDGDPGAADTFATLAQASPVALPVLDKEGLMMIVFTSGTTGKPKGACLTHTNFVHTCLHYLYALAIDRPQRSLLAVPATHIAGFGPLASVTLASGGTLVMAREFKVAPVLELMVREQVTYAVLVPSMYQLLAMAPNIQDYDLSAWKYGIYGGAIMPPAVIERFSQITPGLRMINAYGATETCAVCTIIPPELTSSAPTSVGFSLECDEILIVDPNGKPVPDGESGELWIRGPNVSPGYWNNEEATRQSFNNGFWKSGDIGKRDICGLIYVHDRLKDMINRGGFKVFSAEVENSLMEHPDIEECAVVGVPDPVLGERTFAFVKRRTAELNGETLRAYLRANIADYKVPDFWLVGDEPVPRNQNGKVQKADVRELAKQLHAS